MFRFSPEPCSPSSRNGVQNQPGILFSFIAESCSASPGFPNEKQRFASACAAGRREQAYAILKKSPRFIESLSEEERSRIVHSAAGSGREGALRLVAEFGFNLNAMILKRTPLHDAAWGNHIGTIKLLIQLGADPTIRDGEYDGTPLDWAEYNHQPEAADYLRRIAEN